MTAKRLAKRTKTRLADWGDRAVYLVVRSIVCVLQIPSIGVASALVRPIAWLGWLVAKRHRRMAEDNLRRSFPDWSDQRRRRAVWAVYEHFVRMIVEMAHIPRKLRVSTWKRYATLGHAPRSVDLFVEDRAKIIVTAHFGNWEMAGALLSAVGLRSYTIARDLDNRFLHDFVLRFRQYAGQVMLSKKGEFDRIEQAVRDRETLVSVGDQSAGPRGYFVDFFGRPASTHKAIAILALEHDAPVVVGYAYRTGRGLSYHIRCEEMFDPRDYAGRADAALALTRDFTAGIERAVRLAPEQYLWLHNRWKHQPKARRKRAAA